MRCCLRSFNKELHECVAEEFVRITKAGSCEPIVIKHHYGMPTPNSIAIGTFVVDTNANNDEDLIVPIFSEIGKDICLFSVYRNQKMTYTPAGTRKNVILVPHGWGQVIDDIQKIYVENIKDEKNLVIKSKEEYRISVRSDIRMPKIPGKHIRHIENITTFMNDKCSNINGTVQKILHPVFCYCSQTKENKKIQKNSNQI